jgi:hypothetical protein
MAKISEVVKLHTGMASAVNLLQEFLNAERNRGRMQRYMPVKSHRDAFQTLAKAIDLGPRERCFLLTGTPGTGKSHLLLMLANYLHNTSDQPEVATFLENWQSVDPAPVETLRARRKRRRWLVVVCDYGGSDGFEETLLRAIADACAPEREDFHGMLVTHYHEAVRLLESWKDTEENGTAPISLFSGFKTVLGNVSPDFTMNRLREDLMAHHEEAMVVFRRVHRELLSLDFTPNRNNLVEILKEFMGSPAFKERYDGMAVLYDEFGYVLSEKRISLPVWQNFAEFCRGTTSGMPPCVFVAAAHRSFETYAKGWQDFAKESDRIKEVVLTAEGIEDIIGAIVQPQTESPAWGSEIAPRKNVLNGMANECRALAIFPHLDAPQFTKKISIGAYPMHPMATHCLLKLANEIGSNNRTAFTFFSGGLEAGDIGSFPWFLESHSILDGDRLRLYTTDLLADYFAKEMRSDNRELREALRKVVVDYEASIRDFQKVAARDLFGGETEIAEYRKILKALLVYQLVDMPATRDNLALGLFQTTPVERTTFGNRLGPLVENNILFVNRSANTYEFRSADSVPLDDLIEKYQSDQDNRPSDLAQELLEVRVDRTWPDKAPLAIAAKEGTLKKNDQWLPASGYNSLYAEDKRARRMFATPDQLAATYTVQRRAAMGSSCVTREEAVDYFTAQEVALHEKTDPSESYEAVCVYVICETREEVDRAIEAARKNLTERVLLAIPREPIPVTDVIMQIRAAVAIKASADYEKYPLSDRSRLDDIYGNDHSGAQGAYIRVRQQYLEGRDCSWYGKVGSIVANRPNSAHQALDQTLDRLYTGRNKVTWSDFNLAHKSSLRDDRSIGRNVALKDAVDALLTAHRPIEIDKTFGSDKGQIKYLQKILFNQDVLVQLPGSKDPVMHCEVQQDETKYIGKYPALADLKRQIESLADGEQLPVLRLVEKSVQAPYGLGPEAVVLFFAVIVRTFGDSLIIKRASDAIGEVQLKSFSNLAELLRGTSPTAYLQRRPITQAQRDLAKCLYSLFVGKEVAVDEQPSLHAAFDALVSWWEKLPAVAQVSSLYAGDDEKGVDRLITAMQARAGAEASEFMFKRLQVVCGKSEDDLIDGPRADEILAELIRIKEQMEQSFTVLKESLAAEVRGVFGVTGNTYMDLQNGIMDWFNTLDENQRDMSGSWHANESKPLISYLRTIESLEKTLFELVPVGFGLPKVADWTSDKSQDYATKFKDGKAHVEANAIKVPPPALTAGTGTELKNVPGGHQVSFRGEASLTVASPGNGIVVLVSDTGEDPRAPGAQVETVAKSHEFRVKGKIRTLKLVSRDSVGNTGKLITVEFVNQDGKHEIERPAQTLLPGDDEIVKFALPKDVLGLTATVKSLVATVVKAEIVSPREVVAVLCKVAAEMDGK